MKIHHLFACAAVGSVAMLAAACGDDSAGMGGSGATGSTSTHGATTNAASSTHTGAAVSGSTGTSSSQCATDVCAMYGAAVPAVAGQIVDQAAGDPEFMPFFQPLVDSGPQAVADFKTSLGNFIAVAYGCAAASTYTGPDMVSAHTGLDITSTQYDDFITLIAGVLADNGVPQADISNCFAPPLVDSAFKATVVGH